MNSESDKESSHLGCSHTVTQGRAGENGMWCIKCRFKIFEVERRQCKDCAHMFESVNYTGCSKKLMAVMPTMTVTYKISEGTCWQELTPLSNTAPCYARPTTEINMKFKCECSMTTGVLGDGCQTCNTELAIECLPSPLELSKDLAMNAGFTTDQAEEIASDVYQPLLSLITTLSNKINELAKAV